jgi:two-component system sensor kinase FixL
MEAQVCVEDSGPGVSPDVASSLFESFASVKAAGMGVGLSISRTIIEAHGGRIWLDEACAGGASICFSLHLAEGSAGAAIVP